MKAQLFGKKEGREKTRALDRCEGNCTSRGEQLTRWHWEDKPPSASTERHLVIVLARYKHPRCMPAMQLARQGNIASISSLRTEVQGHDDPIGHG